MVDQPDSTPVKSVRVADEPLTPLGYQQITSLSSATALTVPDLARFALIEAEAQGVRWRDDGTNPTAAIGMPLSAGSTIWYVGNLEDIKFIEDTAGGILNVTYYGY